VRHADVFLLRGRLAFGSKDQAAPFPSALVLWAQARGDRHTRMREVFADAWHLR
jgi:hypothetical protein